MARNGFKYYISLQFCDKNPSYLLETRLQKALDRADFLKLAWKFSFQGNVSRSSYINISLHHFYQYGLLECHKILFKYSKLFGSLWSFSLPLKESRVSFPFRRTLPRKLSNCFPLERLYPRNACSDTHACNTFLPAPECLCNISVGIPYSSSLFCSVCKWEMWFRVCGMLGLSWFIYKINLNACSTEAMWNLLRSTLHIEIPKDFLTNTWNGIKEIKLAMHLSIFSSILKGWGKKKSLKDDCLLSVSAGGVLCITPASHWNRYLKQQQQSGYISSFHGAGSRLTLALVSEQSRLHITELQGEERLGTRTLNDCYLHILLPEQWGPTWSWHSIHTSAGPWTCAPGRQQQKGELQRMSQPFHRHQYQCM